MGENKKQMGVNKFDTYKALKVKDKYFTPLEKRLMMIFFEIIYKPIFAIITQNIGKEWLTKENSKKGKLDLIKAIKAGKVQYTGKDFEGTFNSIISKEIKEMGGVWDRKYKRWHVDMNKLPFDIRMAIGQAQMKDKALNAEIEAFLDRVENLIQGNKTDYNMQPEFNAVVEDMDQLFRDGIEGITTAPELTEEMKRNITENWSENMNLYIKGWTEESIKRLRKRVWNNTLNGFRSKDLIAEIKHDYNVTTNKARFLARQETSLLMSQFREERYKSAGVERYRWSTAGDSRVRNRHAELNGHIFSWDNPPIVDDLGHRAHPGQDFNCRCVAIPIID